MAASQSEEQVFFGGIYAALPSRLMVGPYTHAEAFATRPAGFHFAGMPLPELRSRYVVSCLLPSTMLPAAPATTPPPPRSPRPPSSSTSSYDVGACEGQERSSLPQDTVAVIAQARTTAADFIAQMNARRQLQRSTAGRVGATTSASLPLPPSAKIGRSQRGERSDGSRSLAGAPESVVRQLAQENDGIRAVVEKVLGPEHFTQCTMAQDSLDNTGDVAEAMDRIAQVLADDAEAMVYVYSGSGRNRASALAMYYLQRKEGLPLGEIFSRLPTSTPQISFLTTLIAADKQTRADGTASFDEEHYAHLYFTRRYPSKTAALIRAAVTSCSGDMAGVDKLLQDELVFSSTSARSAARTVGTRYGGAGPIGGTASEGGDRASCYNESFDSRAVLADGGSWHPSTSASSLSLSSDALMTEDGASVTLTAIDEEIISSVCKALQAAGMPVSRVDVTESYVRHRRNRHRVLREFLAKNGVHAAVQAPPSASTLATPTASLQHSVARQRSSGDCSTVEAAIGGQMTFPTVGGERSC